MPELGKRALKLVNGDARLLGTAPNIVLNESVEFCAPKAERKQWFATEKTEIKERIAEIVVFIEKWVIPVFAELRTPEELVDSYEAHGGHIDFKQDHWYIRVAAAYQIAGNNAAALRVLEKRFDNPLGRKRYAAAFKNLASHESNTT